MQYVVTSMVGRLLLSLVAVFTAVSPFYADWNETHLFNPLWPPHAKFHGAHTMAMGALLGASALAFLWLRNSKAPRLPLLAGTIFTSLYWVGQAIAFAFPQVAWTDPNLLPPGQTMQSLPIQVPLLLIVLTLIALGSTLALYGDTHRERSRL